VLSAKFGHQLRPSLFDGFQATLDLSGFLVQIGQFLLELFPVQASLAALLADQGLDFVPQQPESRIPVHVVLSKLQLASPNSSDDFLLRQAEFLPG
jgi:hypothetical protein